MPGTTAGTWWASTLTRRLAGCGIARGFRGGVPFGYRYGTDGFLEVNSDEATLIPVIFEQYVGKRLGSRSIANLLTERGHRARANRPWSFRGVLTVLRNRVYLGEVFFRDTWHPAPHPRLMDAERW